MTDKTFTLAQAAPEFPPLVDRDELIALLQDLASVNLSREACERQARRMVDDLIARGLTFAAQPPAAPVEPKQGSAAWRDSAIFPQLPNPPPVRAEVDRQKLLDTLPLQFEDGPDYCTVRDAGGKDFALTVQPDILKEMESALRVALVSSMPHSQCSADTVNAEYIKAFVKELRKEPHPSFRQDKKAADLIETLYLMTLGTRAEPQRSAGNEDIALAEKMLSDHIEKFHDFDSQPHEVPPELASLRAIQHHLIGSMMFRDEPESK